MSSRGPQTSMLKRGTPTAGKTVYSFMSFTLGFIMKDELMRMEDLLNIVRVRRLTLAGHVLRLPSDRPASVAIQWVPDGGKRRRGRPRKTW